MTRGEQKFADMVFVVLAIGAGACFGVGAGSAWIGAGAFLAVLALKN